MVPDETISVLMWAFEYELPNLSLVLTAMIPADTESQAVAAFRKRRPHGKIRKINGQPVQDDGINFTFLNRPDDD